MMKLGDVFPYPEYRKYQKEAIFLLKKGLFNQNKKYFFLKMPTGGGKSGIAYTLCKYYIENYRQEYKNTVPKDDDDKDNSITKPLCVICTYTKQLQRQYSEDSNFDKKIIEHLWSAKDYQCQEFPSDYNIHYGDPYCLKQNCNYFKKRICEYIKQRNKFYKSQIGIVNYSYILNLIKGDDQIINKSLLVCDEGHLLDEILCNTYIINFSFSSFKQIYNTLSNIDETYYNSCNSDLDNFKMLLSVIIRNKDNNDCFEGLLELCNKILLIFEKHSMKITKFLKGIPENVKLKNKKQVERILRSYEIINSYISQSKIYKESLSSNNRWIVEKTHIKSLSISFKSLLPTNYFHKLTQNTDKVLIMSAHLESSEEIISKYNIKEEEFVYCEIPSIIPVKNRPIYSCNVGYLTAKNTTPKLLDNFVQTTDRIINEINKKIGIDNKQVPGIIHSVSYKNAELILENSKFKEQLLIPSKDDLINFKQYLNENPNKIFVSPTLLQGVDLPDDKSRFQIFFKIPYPSLADKWLKERMIHNSKYYDMKTITNLEQGCGRSLRSIDDWCFTFILDGMINILIKKNHQYFSTDFIDSIKKIKI